VSGAKAKHGPQCACEDCNWRRQSVLREARWIADGEAKARAEGHAVGYAEAVAAVLKLFDDKAKYAAEMAVHHDARDEQLDSEDWSHEKAGHERVAKMVREHFAKKVGGP